MMILSAGDPVARDICARRMQSEVIDPLAAWLGSADGQDRAIRLNILWMGFLTAWSLVALPPLQDGEALGRASRVGWRTQPRLSWMKPPAEAGDSRFG